MRCATVEIFEPSWNVCLPYQASLLPTKFNSYIVAYCVSTALGIRQITIIERFQFHQIFLYTHIFIPGSGPGLIALLRFLPVLSGLLSQAYWPCTSGRSNVLRRSSDHVLRPRLSDLSLDRDLYCSGNLNISIELGGTSTEHLQMPAQRRVGPSTRC